MINYQPTSKEYQVEHVDDLIGGIDLISDSRQLVATQAVDTKNIIFTMGGFKRSPGVLAYRFGDTFGSGTKILAFAMLGFYFIRAIQTGATTKLQSSDIPSTGAWTDIPSGTLTTDPLADTYFKYWTFVKGKGINAVVSSSNPITASTTRTLTTSTVLTPNALVGNFILINSGAGAGQVLLITGNTANTIYLEGTFDTVPTTSDTFGVYSASDALFLGNKNNLIRKIFGPSSVSTVGTQNFYSIEWHKNRLFGSINGRVYFSNLGAGDYFGPDSYIEVGDQFGDNPPIIKSLGDRLVIYANNGRYDLYGDNPDNFQLVKRGEKSTKNASVANGTNTQYFFSFQGLESLAIADNQTVAESLPISRNLMLLNNFGAYSKTEVYNNRVYVFSNTTQYGTSPITGFVYDIEMSLAKGYPVWSKIELPKSVTAVWFEKSDSRLYIAMDGCIGYLNESSTYSDIGSASDYFSSTYTTGQRIQKDRERKKLYRKCRDVFNVSQSGTVNVYVSYDGGTFTLLNSQAFTGTSQSVELEINTFLNRQAKDIAYKYEVVWTGTAGIFENVSHDTYYTYTAKPL